MIQLKNKFQQSTSGTYQYCNNIIKIHSQAMKVFAKKTLNSYDIYRMIEVSSQETFTLIIKPDVNVFYPENIRDEHGDLFIEELSDNQINFMGWNGKNQ